MATVRIAMMIVKVALRTKAALFFTFIFPLIFLFAYDAIFARGNPSVAAYLFGPVITLQILGSSFFGLGLHSVMERERGSLRRYRLAPIGPGTMVASNLLASYALLLPTVALLVFCAIVIFHMPLTISIFNLWILVTVGMFAFAGFGLTVASIANTMQEAQIYNNVVWFPLLFLSGATFPLPMLPHWIQRVATFLPATYLVDTFQGIMSQRETLSAHGAEMVVLLISGIFGLLIALKLFRWEKDESINGSRKLMAMTCVVPFIVMGLWMNARSNFAASWSKTFAMASGKTTKPDAHKNQPPRLVSNFDGGALTTSFGSGWTVTTDSMMGGKSTAQMKVVEGGAEGSKDSLLISGELAGGSIFPWAGAMFFPGSKPFTAANLAGENGISFLAKGDGRGYSVMMFSSNLGRIPATHSFTPSGAWKEYDIPFSAFGNLDPHSLEGVAFSASGAPGKFALQIDNVEFK
ncbi:MAG TPA: CIA30 family protein [Terriglobia bacterium]|nr:CIA30 family protein [Terriglobia bacterium]